MTNYAVEVYLKNGEVLRTEESFEDEKDPDEMIQWELEDRTSPWKAIGHLTIWFEQIVGWSTQELNS